MTANRSLQFNNTSEAYAFLKELGAPDKLIRHVSLVGEAAEVLIEKLNRLNVPFDARFVRLGVAFHDAGKIKYPEELRVKGNRHESAGEEFLLQQGLSPELARCCVSHGQGQILEKRVVEKTAQLIAREPWNLFIEMDSYFEQIAAGGVERLLQSA